MTLVWCVMQIADYLFTRQSAGIIFFRPLRGLEVPSTRIPQACAWG